jgi:hypothetical protein
LKTIHFRWSCKNQKLNQKAADLFYSIVFFSLILVFVNINNKNLKIQFLGHLLKSMFSSKDANSIRLSNPYKPHSTDTISEDDVIGGLSLIGIFI